MMYIECPKCHGNNEMLTMVNFNELLTKRETTVKCEYCGTEFIIYFGIDKFEAKLMTQDEMKGGNDTDSDYKLPEDLGILNFQKCWLAKDCGSRTFYSDGKNVYNRVGVQVSEETMKKYNLYDLIGKEYNLHDLLGDKDNADG